MGAHSNLGVFSASQEIIATAASTSTVDMAQAVNQYGVSGNLWLCIRVAVAPTVATDTIAIILQTDADDGAGDPAGTWYTVFAPFCGMAGDALAEVLVSDSRLDAAGDWVYRAPVPMEMLERHVRLYYLNETASTGTQTYDAWLNDGPPQSDFDKQVYVSPVGQP